MMELACESLFIYSQSKGYIKIRVVAEGLLLLTRCLIMMTGVYVYQDRQKYVLYIFSGAQLTASFVYMVYYWVYFCFMLRYKNPDPTVVSNLADFMPSLEATDDYKKNDGDIQETSSNIDMDQFEIAISFVKQTVVKQLLTEGEKFIMSFFDLIEFADQGIFDMVNNLASMAARFIFAPIEESTYLMFTKIVGDRNKRPEDLSNAAKSELQTILTRITRLMVHLGLIVLVFGYNYSRLLLLIYAGRSMMDTAVYLLQINCAYILIIAINGVTESFTFSAMNSGQLDQFNATLTILSVLYLIESCFMVKIFGSVGFIYANIVNYFIRIVVSCTFIRNFFDAASISFYPVAEFRPSFNVMSTLFVNFLIMRTSNVIFCCDTNYTILIHLAVGVTNLLIVTYVMYRKETDLVAFIFNSLKAK